MSVSNDVIKIIVVENCRQKNFMLKHKSYRILKVDFMALTQQPQSEHLDLKCCRCCSCLFTIINTGPVYRGWVQFDNEPVPDELIGHTLLVSSDLLV